MKNGTATPLGTRSAEGGTRNEETSAAAEGLEQGAEGAPGLEPGVAVSPEGDGTASAPGTEGKPGSEGEEKLSPEIQEKIDRRIGKEVARRKVSEEALATLEAKTEKLAAQLDDATAKDARGMGLHPDYVKAEDVEVLKRDTALSETESWCLEHFEGFTGTGDEENPEYTGAQVRKRYAEIRAECKTVGAKAAFIRERIQREMDEDLQAGRTARSSERGTRKAERGNQKSKTPIPPVIPQGGGAAGNPPASAGKEKSGFDAKKMMETGVTADSIQKEFEKVL